MAISAGPLFKFNPSVSFHVKSNSMFALLEREVAGKNTMWYQGEEYKLLKPRRCPMPVPIICLDEHVRQFAERFRHELSKPQYQYFVIVLLGLMLCEGTRTLRGLLRQVADGPSLADLWLGHFREEMQPKVAAELQRQRQEQPKRRGRPKVPVVTGYLIGDDSTIEKRKGKKMEGLGRHHSTTQDKRVRGHSLVESLYVLLGRRCPLAPQLYRQQAVCAAEDVPFESLIDLMEAVIRTFEPVAGTLTHVLLDTRVSAPNAFGERHGSGGS
jgi:hypothetical protein